MEFLRYKNRIVLLYAIPETDRNSLKLDIINIICNRDKNTFYSLTESDDEISLLIDELHLEKLTNNWEGNKYYVALRIVETNGFMEQAGLISRMANIFAELEIPILYITSYNNNYILLEEEYMDKAQKNITIISEFT